MTPNINVALLETPRFAICTVKVTGEGEWEHDALRFDMDEWAELPDTTEVYGADLMTDGTGWEPCNVDGDSAREIMRQVGEYPAA